MKKVKIENSNTEMTKTKFIDACRKLARADLYTFFLEKGRHGTERLGFDLMGTTDRHFEIIWRNYGDLFNLIIYKPHREVETILKSLNLQDLFLIKKTKSGEWSRLTASK